MEIRRDTIEKLWKVFDKNRDLVKRGYYKGFQLYETPTGKVITIKLKNTTGWYSLVCFYDLPEFRVDVYDMHVFERYQERFRRGTGKDIITEFIRRGNCGGTLLAKDDGRAEKRIPDGATLGTVGDGLVYYKTYLPDKMLRENQMEYLLELEDHVDN